MGLISYLADYFKVSMISSLFNYYYYYYCNASPPNNNIHGCKRKKLNETTTEDTDYYDEPSNIVVALSEEIRELILTKLDLVDYIRFMAVCRSWRSIAVTAKRKKQLHLRPPIPWLMLSSTTEKTHYHGFFSLSHGKVFRLNLPEVCGARCCGSSWGWLIMAGQTGRNFLLNPFSRVRIQLPSQTTLPIDFHIPFPDFQLPIPEFQQWKRGPFFIRKAILLSPPTTTTTTTNSFSALNGNDVVESTVADDDCLIVAIYASHILGICRPGDNTWTDSGYDPNIQELLRRLEDVIIYKGRLVGVTIRLDLIHVELGGPSPKATSWNIPIPVGYDFSAPRGGESIYLVESCGDLLMVIRSWSSFRDDQKRRWTVPPPKTSMFRIYKLDSRGPHWDVVETLGDQMLFVGTTGGISLSATHYSGFQGNCIYFTDDNFHNVAVTHDGDGPQPCRDLGVFHLNDNSIEPFFPNDSHSYRSPPVWFTPNQ